MTLSKFLEKDAFEQSLCVALIGTFIDTYSDGTFDSMLYQVDDFYVEAVVHAAKQEMYGFKVFQSLELLEPYLKKIDVSLLVA